MGASPPGPGTTRKSVHRVIKSVGPYLHQIISTPLHPTMCAHPMPIALPSPIKLVVLLLPQIKNLRTRKRTNGKTVSTKMFSVWRQQALRRQQALPESVQCLHHASCHPLRDHRLERNKSPNKRPNNRNSRDFREAATSHSSGASSKQGQPRH